TEGGQVTGGPVTNMTRVPARCLAIVALGAFLAVGLAPGRAQEFEVPGGADEKQPATAKVIALDARLRPADPFHETNRPDGKLTTARRGEVIALVITGTPKEGWHTYPMTVRSEDEKAQSISQLTRLSLKATPGLTPLWPRQEVPEPEWVAEEGVGVALE